MIIPEIPQDKRQKFGWVKVRGFIDTYELNQYKLMPMGNGNLFLPVKKEIRKAIGKEAGDTAKVKLFIDNTPLKIPVELIECFNNEDENVYKAYLKLPEGEQKRYLDWIYSAKSDETKANRIAQMMEDLHP